MSVKTFCRGRWGAVIFATLSDGTCPATEFLDTYGVKEKAKIAVLLQRYADHGYITNREKFKKIAPDLYEFKGHQVRMFCYSEGRSMVVTHGAIKKRDDLNPADLDRARRIRDEYTASQQRKK
jgi:Phage derived protein Gp49-like (DUF891)